MADLTPNAMKLNKAKFKPQDRQKLRVAKGSWAAATDGTLNAGDGDTLDIVTVPADCMIIGVSLHVRTAEGANGTVDIGATGTDITDDLDLWYDAISLAVTTTQPNNGIGGALYTGTSAVDVRVTATTDGADVDIDGAVFDVFVTYVELDAQASTN